MEVRPERLERRSGGLHVFFIKNNIYAEDGGNREVATLLRERRADACGRLARVRQ